MHVSIDRGGTFTDVISLNEQGNITSCKLLSTTQEYPDAPVEGIRRALAAGGGGVPDLASVRMGTTIATNALLERQGLPTALLVSAGLTDALTIGTMARPAIFDLRAARSAPLSHMVLPIEERVQFVRHPDQVLQEFSKSCQPTIVPAASGVGSFAVLQAPDLDAVRSLLLKLHSEHGVECIVVAFAHSYGFPDHEDAVAEVARELGCFRLVVTSARAMPMSKFVPRASTAVVDAAITPLLMDYTASFAGSFPEGTFERVPLKYIASDGGLVAPSQFRASKAVLSGPAGGLVAAAATAGAGGNAVIAFDMGGTSSDVSRYDGKALQHVLSNNISGVEVLAPMLDITTVAAGGGSLLVFRDGLFNVGPESAGASPGPVCYRNAGGKLAVTDANVVLGRVQPDFFPAIFGPQHDQTLDVAAARARFQAVAEQVATETGEVLSVDEVAAGFIRVANEAMARPIRAVTQARGFEPSAHVLAAFGGAGPQHACALAKELGCEWVFVHRHSGILSALGIALADDAGEAQQPLGEQVATAEAFASALGVLRELDAKVRSDMGLAGTASAGAAGAGATDASATQRFLRMRYAGTDTTLMIEVTNESTVDATLEYFAQQHKREFGFTVAREILLDDARVRVVQRSELAKRLLSGDEGWRREVEALPGFSDADVAAQPAPAETTQVYFAESKARESTPIWRLSELPKGAFRAQGPALVIVDTCTIVVDPGCEVYVTQGGNVVVRVASAAAQASTSAKAAASTAIDAVSLSVYSHRFMSIAEQMGKVLQRTAISVNIKERLDFSCALFDCQGGLVANAPHLPVHLGAMGQAVAYQIAQIGLEKWQPGDVVMSNHPGAGGSHLPDITVMSPVFVDGVVQFFVASRGHHADVGGSEPGSMPPFSASIDEEGVAFHSVYVVRNSEFQTEALTALFAPSRARADVLADLRAQAAANTRGATLLMELVQESSLPRVAAAMEALQVASTRAVRSLLDRMLPPAEATRSLRALDYMDDGSRIQLEIKRDPQDGVVCFDFAGTTQQVLTNTNAPVAVTYAAIIYSLRALIDEEIPLNAGCMKGIKVHVPAGTLLHPGDDAPVVGGNVLTSQRVTDVILAAFGALAGSQGDMSNFTFGDDSIAYYETIGGGMGAGPTWAGTSGTQCHMTNTRITDVEVLERRLPVLLRTFALRTGSGGPGAHCGGDGLVREVQFTRSGLRAAVLSERRVLAPKGLAGGADGQAGANFVYRWRTGQVYRLGGKASLGVDKGDIIRIETPGGGGYGAPAPRAEGLDGGTKVGGTGPPHTPTTGLWRPEFQGDSA